MPTVWFQGGIEKVIQNTAYLLDTVAVRTSLVAGLAVNANRQWKRLNEFLASNSLVNDNGGNQDVLVDGLKQTRGWIPGNSRYEWGINAQLAFGIVNLNTQIAGTVFYSEAAVADPTNAILLGCQDTPTVGQGGAVAWGGGVNKYAHWTPRVLSTTVAFQGAIDRLVTQLNPWVNASWNVGFALVRNVNAYVPQGNELNMSAFSATYCTNGDPSSSVASGVVLPFTALERVSSWEAITSEAWDLVREKESAGGVEVKWPQTGGGGGSLTPGEIVDGVVSFIYTGAYSDATAYPLNWDFGPNKTIVAGQNLIYGNTSSARVLNTFVKAA